MDYKATGVSGYTKHPGCNETAEMDGDIDLVVMLDVLVLFSSIKITSIKHKSGGKYTSLVPSIDIGEYLFDGKVYEGKVMNDILITKHSNTEERCTAIEGSVLCFVH